MATQNSRSECEADPSRQELGRLLDEHAASGLSVAEFARRRGMKPWRLYEGLRKQKKARQSRGSSRRRQLIPVELSDAASSSAPLELVLTSGLRLLVHPDFDETALRRLLGVLASC